MFLSIFQNNNTWTFILFYIFYALVLVELLLTLFADKKALPNYYTEVKDKERIPLLAHPNKKAKEVSWIALPIYVLSYFK